MCYLCVLHVTYLCPTLFCYLRTLSYDHKTMALDITQMWNSQQKIIPSKSSHPCGLPYSVTSRCFLMKPNSKHGIANIYMWNSQCREMLYNMLPSDAQMRAKVPPRLLAYMWNLQLHRQTRSDVQLSLLVNLSATYRLWRRGGVASFENQMQTISPRLRALPGPEL